MNCQDIKNKLQQKDEEVAAKTAKTIEYFNLVKDDVVDILINDHIKGEFKSEFYWLHEGDVMKALYEKLGINTRYFTWNPHGFSRVDFWCSNLFCINPMCYKDISMDDLEGIKKAQDEHFAVEDSFYFTLLGGMLMSHLKSKGFKQGFVCNMYSGEKTYSSKFKISRKALENWCCESDKGISFIENKSNISSKAFSILIGIAMAVMMLLLIIYIYVI